MMSVSEDKIEDYGNSGSGKLTTPNATSLGSAFVPMAALLAVSPLRPLRGKEFRPVTPIGLDMSCGLRAEATAAIDLCVFRPRSPT